MSFAKPWMNSGGAAACNWHFPINDDVRRIELGAHGGGAGGRRAAPRPVGRTSGRDVTQSTSQTDLQITWGHGTEAVSGDWLGIVL